MKHEHIYGCISKGVGAVYLIRFDRSMLDKIENRVKEYPEYPERAHRFSYCPECGEKLK